MINKKSKRGFTLIEVIVVLVILAILAAILVPSMIGWINKSQDKQAAATINLLAKAATSAFTETYSKYTSELSDAQQIIVSSSGGPSKDDFDQYFKQEFLSLVGDDVDLSEGYSVFISLNKQKIEVLYITYKHDSKTTTYKRDASGVTIQTQ